MFYLSEGSIYSHLDELENHPGAKIFKKIAKDTNYGPLLPQLFKNANPYTEGFKIANHQIEAIIQ